MRSPHCKGGEGTSRRASVSSNPQPPARCRPEAPGRGRGAAAEQHGRSRPQLHNQVQRGSLPLDIASGARQSP